MTLSARSALTLFLVASVLATSAVVLSADWNSLEVTALAVKLWLLVEAVVVASFLLLLVALRAARERLLFDSLVVSLLALPAVLTAALFTFGNLSQKSNAIESAVVIDGEVLLLAALGIALLAMIGGYQRWVSPRKGYACAYRIGGRGPNGDRGEDLRRRCEAATCLTTRLFSRSRWMSTGTEYATACCSYRNRDG